MGVSSWLFNTLVALGSFAVWVILVSLVIRGWRNRGQRQAASVGDMPTVPADLGEPLRGPHTGLYLGSTMAPSWQDRVAVGDIGDRANATITGYASGILIERSGASSIWIADDAIAAVRTERGIAGKAMTKDGVLVIRWTLPTGTQIDSGLRADDKSSYPEWTSAYSEVTEKAFRDLERADEHTTGTGETDEKDEK